MANDGNLTHFTDIPKVFCPLTYLWGKNTQLLYSIKLPLLIMHSFCSKSKFYVYKIIMCMNPFGSFSRMKYRADRTSLGRAFISRQIEWLALIISQLRPNSGWINPAINQSSTKVFFFPKIHSRKWSLHFTPAKDRNEIRKLQFRNFSSLRTHFWSQSRTEVQFHLNVAIKIVAVVWLAGIRKTKL